MPTRNHRVQDVVSSQAHSAFCTPLELLDDEGLTGFATLNAARAKDLVAKVKARRVANFQRATIANMADSLAAKDT